MNYFLSRTQRLLCFPQRRAIRNCSEISEIINKKENEALRYTKMTPREHVLLRPDSYIGSTSVFENHPVWTYNNLQQSMELRNSSYSPGLLKIFDEILVNAADNKFRDPNMSQIRINVDKSQQLISVWNNGKGLPIVVHPTENVYVPTLIFGSLLTSSNFNDTNDKLVGGRNGYGAKLCNIYSKQFIVETASQETQTKFRQSWYDNMSRCDDPEIYHCEKEEYTKISFVPDTSRFHNVSFDNDLILLLEKRAIDIAGTLEDVEVFFNDKRIEVSSFFNYSRLYDPNCMFLDISKRWKVSLSISENGFQQISFVNNIFTSKGGSHVDYIVENIVSILKQELVSRCASERNIRNQMIKNKLFIMINATITNPSFDSQSKECLNTKSKNFGSLPELNIEKVKEWAVSSGILDELTALINNKKVRKLQQTPDIIPKLEEANKAGTSSSQDCTLIITEGDSAKALAISGLEVVGRDYYGVFPIRGKLLNVSELSSEKLTNNREISNIMNILGLSFGVDYSKSENRGQLRYGKCLILADQDEDGSHIKGLILNFFNSFWPSLIVTGFLCSLKTPLIKAYKNGTVKEFYTNAEYLNWKLLNSDAKDYSIKYYKGLGTSTSAEARDYFRNIKENIVTFTSHDESDQDSIQMAFQRFRASDRKNWIKSKLSTSSCLDVTSKKNETPLSTFVNNELIEFSFLDLKRSIPSLVDGLKPSQRKVLHTMLQFSQRKEIKVNQLAGAVAMRQAYHHGEESLVNTIIRMAQDYVGSNNLPLLQAIGQFGSRHNGGDDAASGRYIYTKLSSFTRHLFPLEDDSLLEYNIEENQTVEPLWYCPIIPLVLVNGAEGIATGWATRILNHSLQGVIDNTKRMVEGREFVHMEPHWNGFNGIITELSENRYSIQGKCSIVSKKNGNTGELPVGVWTVKYKDKVLGPLIKNGFIRDISEYHKERNVKFIIRLSKDASSRSLEQLRSILKLTTVLSTNSMVLFDENGHLQNFSSTLDIFQSYFIVRKNLYKKRLKHLEKYVEAQMMSLNNQKNFIELVLNRGIDLSKPLQAIEEDLQTLHFSKNPISLLKHENADYSYLLDLPLWKLSLKEVEKLENKQLKKKEEFDRIVNMSWREVWIQELEKLEKL